ncbi:MAG: hypothetical protein KC486_24860, partial [Myxococcales bacterium]|nr:hypothetical protein [Myxococcales bacterium]
RSTGYVCLSPVNGMLFCLALFAADRGHPELGQGLDGIEYWFWEDDVRGLRIVGARSDIWDSAFLVQALCEGPKTPAARRLLVGLCDWLPRAQLLRALADGAEHYRSPARGGWGFADEHHPWPVSDCTAEAIEALLRAHEEGFGGLPPARLLDAVRFILHRQNPDGGFGSYEPRRGSMVLKGFNPAEIYGNCMLEYSYTECTASCVRGLATARAHLGAAMPARLHKRVDRAIRDGVERLLASQDRDGGWAGFWGINYTYGTFFVVSALRAVGLAPSHPALTGARRYLLSRQRPDGGWGESYTGMLDGSDRPLPADEPSLVVQTAWAVLALQELDRRAEPVRRAIERGIDYLRARQQEDGSWPRERASGCFFNTAVLEYDLYRQVFPTWALARQLGPRPRPPA